MDNVPDTRLLTGHSFHSHGAAAQMPNRQYTASLCAMLAHSSSVGVHHAFVVEQVQQDKTAPNDSCI